MNTTNPQAATFAERVSQNLCSATGMSLTVCSATHVSCVIGCCRWFNNIVSLEHRWMPIKWPNMKHNCLSESKLFSICPCVESRARHFRSLSWTAGSFYVTFYHRLTIIYPFRSNVDDAVDLQMNLNCASCGGTRHGWASLMMIWRFCHTITFPFRWAAAARGHRTWAAWHIEWFGIFRLLLLSPEWSRKSLRVFNLALCALCVADILLYIRLDVDIPIYRLEKCMPLHWAPLDGAISFYKIIFSHYFSLSLPPAREKWISFFRSRIYFSLPV